MRRGPGSRPLLVIGLLLVAAALTEFYLPERAIEVAREVAASAQ